MLITLHQLSSMTDMVFDYCIVGTGPAGMTLALNLDRENIKVLVLEAGGEQWSKESQSVYDGKVIGDPYFDLDVTRLRYFGGTSGHWQGVCRTLDEIDFQKKEAFPDAHWPINKSELDFYFQRAADTLEIPGIPDDVVVSAEEGVKQVFFVQSPPVKFGQKYKEELINSKSIFLCLNANVTCVNTNGSQVTNIDVQNYDGVKIKVHARNYVIATGGIENSRLLLWSNQKSNGQLVKKESPLGAYWMEHPHFEIGSAILDLDSSKKFYSLDPEKQKNLGLLNCGLRLQPENYSGTRKMIADLACTAPKLAVWSANKLGKNLFCGASLRAAWEQEPIKENCIKLSATEVDQFGVPRTELHWQKTKKDIRTVRDTAVQLGKYLIASKNGRIKLHDWVINDGKFPDYDWLGGFHHMGGTRMAADSVHGVVDKNCKVFGQKNLYVTGSSVFPSGGHANPTLSIVQLSTRLADHLLQKRG